MLSSRKTFQLLNTSVPVPSAQLYIFFNLRFLPEVPPFIYFRQPFFEDTLKDAKKRPKVGKTHQAQNLTKTKRNFP
jgi:hypothetical protein